MPRLNVVEPVAARRALPGESVVTPQMALKSLAGKLQVQDPAVQKLLGLEDRRLWLHQRHHVIELVPRDQRRDVKMSLFVIEQVNKHWPSLQLEAYGRL